VDPAGAAQVVAVRGAASLASSIAVPASSTSVLRASDRRNRTSKLNKHRALGPMVSPCRRAASARASRSVRMKTAWALTENRGIQRVAHSAKPSAKRL
jgi:hypothetical protein